MFLRSGNPLMTFLLSYHVWETSKIRHATSCYVMPRHATSCHLMSRHVTSCHVMPRHATLLCQLYCHVTSCHVVMSMSSCHVTSRQVTSCHVHATSCHVMSRHVTSCHVMSRHVRHVMPRHATACHVISRHVTSRNVTSCHVMSRHVTSYHVTSCHVMSRHIMSCHVMSRRKSRDCHTINASLSTDFFHTQLIQVRHNRVRWLSRRVPIPYRISGILSSFFYFFFYSPFVLRNYSTDSHQIFRNCVFWCSLNNPVVLKFFWRHLAEKNAKNSENLVKISRVDSDFWQ